MARSVRLTLWGQPGAAYEIHASTNLMDWALLDTVTNQLGTMQFTDTSATNFSRRFYRAMERPQP